MPISFNTPQVVTFSRTPVNPPRFGYNPVHEAEELDNKADKLRKALPGLREAYEATNKKELDDFHQIDNGFKALSALLKDLPKDPTHALKLLREQAGKLVELWTPYSEKTRIEANNALASYVNTKLDYLQTELAYKDTCGYL